MPTCRRCGSSNVYCNKVVLFFIPAYKCRDCGEEFA